MPALDPSPAPCRCQAVACLAEPGPQPRFTAVTYLDTRLWQAMAAAALLRNNLWIYGVGGIIIPFIGIKLIDLAITRVGLA